MPQVINIRRGNSQKCVSPLFQPERINVRIMKKTQTKTKQNQKKKAKHMHKQQKTQVGFTTRTPMKRSDGCPALQLVRYLT